MHVWSLDGEDPLEREMATHSSILAWRIPWTEETGGLQSMGSQRVGHDWSNLACMHAWVLIDVKWYLVILILIFLISDVEYLFMYLLTVCLSMSFLEKYLLHSFPIFQSRCCCCCSWVPLDINSLSDIWFANISSVSGGCLFILSLASFAMRETFSLM